MDSTFRSMLRIFAGGLLALAVIWSIAGAAGNVVPEYGFVLSNTWAYAMPWPLPIWSGVMWYVIGCLVVLYTEHQDPSPPDEDDLMGFGLLVYAVILVVSGLISWAFHGLGATFSLVVFGAFGFILGRSMYPCPMQTTVPLAFLCVASWNGVWNGWWSGLIHGLFAVALCLIGMAYRKVFDPHQISESFS